MRYIEEKILVYTSCKTIWKAWANKYLPNGLEEGKCGHVVSDKRGVKFKILSFKENESLTIVWYSAFIKLVFYHFVEAKDKGSLITCKVELKGFFSFIIKPLIQGKIRQSLKLSMQQFSREFNGLC